MARRFGSVGNDVFQPLNSGDNETYGFEGNDTFIDGAGNDTMLGGRDNDTFILKDGNGFNVIDGGDGNDTLDYSGVTQSLQLWPLPQQWGVVVDLMQGFGDSVANPGIGSTSYDEIHGIENVIGTKFDDMITGNMDANIIKTGAGQDKVFDYGSGDTLDGGDGIDTVSYEYSTAGVNVDLLSGAASGGFAQKDTVLNFEDIIASEYGDKVFGTKAGNFVWAGGGDDLVDGRGGNDELFGAGGKDTILGGDGNDYIDGGGQNDILTGGLGLDTFRFTQSTLANHDVITDFEAGRDTLRLEWFGDGPEVDYAWQGGATGSLVITLGPDPSNTVTLQNLSLMEANYIIQHDIEII